MPLISIEEFTPSMLPKAFKKETKDLIGAAIMLGWTVHMTTDQSVTITSYDGRKKYHFGLNGRASINHNRIKRDLVRFAAPDRAELADIAAGNNAIGDAALAVLIDKMERDTTIMDMRPELEEEKKRERERKEAKRAERHIVSEKPMLAKASEGRGYTSRVAIERHWSDGTVDYKCVDCDYSNPNRLSIRSHRVAHREAGRTGKPPSMKVEVPNAATYKPRPERIAALAQALADAMAAGATDPESIAREALTWVHEQSKKGTHLSTEREEMTPEEVLDRIRSLVDSSGERLRQQQELEQAKAEMAQEMERMRQEVDAAWAQVEEQRALATKARETLEAFRELLSSELKGETA